MGVRLSRREALWLSVAGALAAALPSCGSDHRRSSQPPTSSQPKGDDTYDLDNEGYDPASGESGTPEPPAQPGEVPPAASVPTQWLPPVGGQTLGNCFAWATVYGLATFYAARKSQTPPKSADLVAGPDYAYIRYQFTRNIPVNTCLGGNITRCLDWLRSNGGTPSLAAAPNVHNQGSRPAQCPADWSEYGSKVIAPDPRFLIPPYKTTQITGTDGLKNVRAVIASGFPIAYGTLYYTDFFHYKGKPSVYVGNGEVRKGNDGKPKGHALLIIGYDDARGAVRIQNSHGTSYGEKGYAWLAYDTLEKTAQGVGAYVPDPA